MHSVKLISLNIFNAQVQLLLFLLIFIVESWIIFNSLLHSIREEKKDTTTTKNLQIMFKFYWGASSIHHLEVDISLWFWWVCVKCFKLFFCSSLHYCVSHLSFKNKYLILWQCSVNFLNKYELKTFTIVLFFDDSLTNYMHQWAKLYYCNEQFWYWIQGWRFLDC